jgi:Fe2+ transport system protein FeoA
MGTDLQIKQILASQENATRLREMGLFESQIIRLLSRTPNVICLVYNARLGLGQKVADLIMVEDAGLARK